MADAAGDQADENLAGARLGELDILDHERLSEFLEHRGAHLHGLIIAQLNREAQAPRRHG